MKIETKFSVNDKVWIINHSGALVETIIASINIIAYGSTHQNISLRNTIKTEYYLEYIGAPSSTCSGMKEDNMYLSKQEAGEAWMKSQGLKCGVSNN